MEVDSAVVTLSGTVSDYVKKMAAQQAAHRVEGVLDVVNHIQVHVPGLFERTDTQIAQAVRHAMEWDVVVPNAQIRSTVADGWVDRGGEVGTWHERNAAEVVLRQVQRVRIEPLGAALPVQADGDAWGITPLEVEVVPRKLLAPTGRDPASHL